MHENFDLETGKIYLNAGTHSISPRSVHEAVHRHLRDYERDPTLGLMRVWPRLWSAQERLAAFLGADPADLFLAGSVTYAMNQFILGAPLAPGQEILSSNLEYGAIERVCRFRAERDSLSFRKFRLPAEGAELDRLGDEGVVRAIVGELRAETGMLVVSHVFMPNGYVLPVEMLARETKKRGVQLVVDGAHAAGSLALDFRKFADVDYYSANLHKWMLGPKGSAFGWVAKRRQQALVPLTAGWTTYDPSAQFQSFLVAGEFASRFLHSYCCDFSPYLGIGAMLDFWEEQGAESIRSRLYALQVNLEALLEQKLGWKTISPARSRRGPLLSYELPERWREAGQKNIVRVEREHGLVIGVPWLDGRWVLRLSPHIHNRDSDLERAVEILKISMA